MPLPAFVPPPEPVSEERKQEILADPRVVATANRVCYHAPEPTFFVNNWGIGQRTAFAYYSPSITPQNIKWDVNATSLCRAETRIT